MRKITPFLLLGSILLAMVSCQKEKSLETLGATPGNSGSSGTEVGTWKYLIQNRYITKPLKEMPESVLRNQFITLIYYNQ